MDAIKKLQEQIDKRLCLDTQPESRRFSNTGGSLPKSNKVMADQALQMFDQFHAPRLLHEAKQLSGGDGLVSDASVPTSFLRTVIRESLYKMVGLEFVNADTEVFGPSITVPYSYRDTTAAGRNHTRSYEGQEIRRAGVIQTAETAYPIPQKISFETSDELRYLTSNSNLNWNAVTENMDNAVRIVQEDTDQIILNEMLHASDEYGAVQVVSENLQPQADDTNQILVLANFPVVRPRRLYDLQGSQVGNTINPITVTYNSVARSEYDGTGTQPAGVYYVLDYNLGEIFLVDEAGALQTPGSAVPFTISYSYATNVYNFNTDLGSALAEDHWNTFLYRYGLRKAVIEDDRYYLPNFGLMSGTAMTQIEQAKQFAANYSRAGTDLSANGTLGRVKDIPNWKVFGPGLHYGDQRVLIGERGVTRYRLLKPWEMNNLQDQRGPNGRFTGKKEAYGDQWIAVHTPTQLKGAFTSLVLYSATARVARVYPV